MPPSPSTAVGSNISLIDSKNVGTPLTPLEENRWLVSTFGLPPSSSISAASFYEVGRSQFNAGRYHLAAKCLEIYLARLGATNATTASTVNKPLKHGSTLGGGGFTAAAGPIAPSRLTTNTTGQSLPVAPLHLLGHAHLRLGSLRRARECFLGCVRLGYDTDWQMVVQTELDVGAAARAAAAQQGIRGAEAVATLHKHIEAHIAQQRRERKEITIDNTLDMEPEASVSHTIDPNAFNTAVASSMIDEANQVNLMWNPNANAAFDSHISVNPLSTEEQPIVTLSSDPIAGLIRPVSPGGGGMQEIGTGTFTVYHVGQ
jgi:hypothetical protein